MQLIRGQKLKLSDILNNQQTFSLQITPPTGITLDIALFGLDNQAKLSNEDYMIFYNQPQSPCQSITLTQNDPSQVIFDVNLATLPPSWQLSELDGSPAYKRPCFLASSCNTPVNTPV